MYTPAPDKIPDQRFDLTEPSIYGELSLETDYDTGSKSSEPENSSDLKRSEYKAICLIRSLLRDIRADFQMIRNSMIVLLSLDPALDQKGCNAETSEIHKKMIQRCGNSIDAKLRSVHIIFDKHPCISSHDSDTVQIIENKWELQKDLYKNYLSDESTKKIKLEKCKQYLEENIYSCSFLTVPSRVAAHLKTLKSGYALNFYEEFKDEFCSEEQANELLKYLARHPAFIDDIIDTSQGSIFKVDPKTKRWKSYVRVFAAFVLGVGAIIGSFWLLRERIGHEYITGILKMYLVFVSGALFHIFIDAMKATKSSTGLKFRSIEDWFLWINIKELSIITGILLLDFTFIGLVIIFDPGVIIDPLTLAAAGYSFDSIGEVVSGRFETILSTKGGSLKEKISSMK